MTPSTYPPRAPENLLLSALPREKYETLLPHLQQVQLVREQVLHEIGAAAEYAYFPLKGMISLLSITEDGGIIEIGVIGNAGVVGVSAILGVKLSPYRAMVQIPSVAMRIKADVLKSEFNRGGQLTNVLLSYAHALLIQVSQFAVCNHFHTLEKRFCLWLLITRDILRADTFEFTQEFLSDMLGVPRTSISMTASALQKAGLIGSRRGKIQLLDQRGLEAAVCECYGVIREENERVFTR